MGSRRLATAAVDFGPRRSKSGRRAHQHRRPARIDTRAGALEDDRQSAPDLVGAGRPGRVGGRMDAAVFGRVDLDRLHRRDDRDCSDAPVYHRDSSAPARDLQAQPPAGGRYRPRGWTVANRDAADSACASSVADDRRDRAHAASTVRESSTIARVGDCGACKVGDPARSSRLLREHGRGRRSRDRRGDFGRLRKKPGRAARGSIRRLVDVRRRRSRDGRVCRRRLRAPSRSPRPTRARFASRLDAPGVFSRSS